MINLKSLNEYVVPQHFKMEGIHTLQDLLRGGDWMTKIDLKKQSTRRADRYFASRPSSTSTSSPACHSACHALPGSFEAGTNPTQRVGDKASGIHRRYTRFGGDGGDRAESHLSTNIPVGKPGLYRTPRENHDHPFPGDGIPWDDGRFQNNGTTITGSEVEETSFGSCKDQSATPSAREVSRLLGKFNSVTRAVSPSAEQYRETWP